MSSKPDEFLWGASTSSYQVEGGLTTQWSVWEQAKAQKLARTMPKRFKWLPRQEQIAPLMADPANYISGAGVEHFQRYEEDFDLLQQLHMNSFRFGMEWARLEPREGQWDVEAVQHYHRYIAALKQRGIEPVLTLWHWTMPTWFTEKGAFEKKQNLRYFERFVAKITEEYGPQLRYILTLNEPNVYMSFSYAIGEWPPQRRNLFKMLRVYANLAEAHRTAYRVIKGTFPDIQVGLPMNLGEIRPKKPQSALNRKVVSYASWLWNWWFLDKVRESQDFIGVNYYFTDYRDAIGRLRNPKEPVSDTGWYMNPAGIEQVLMATWRRYQKPLLITENGVADSGDKFRQWWISETLQAMDRAKNAGVPLMGYLHWSLLDNFEWSYGWWPHFGLVAVDRTTMQRTIRPSAYWLAEQIKK